MLDGLGWLYPSGLMSVVVAGPDARLVEGLLERLALLEDENAALREREQALEAERERLRGEVERRRVENDRLRGESERLRARNERLREEIQALRRAAKRQAAPCGVWASGAAAPSGADLRRAGCRRCAAGRRAVAFASWLGHGPAASCSAMPTAGRPAPRTRCVASCSARWHCGTRTRPATSTRTRSPPKPTGSTRSSAPSSPKRRSPRQPAAAGASGSGARGAVQVPAPPRGCRHQLACRARHPSCRGLPQAPGRQPHSGRCRHLAGPHQPAADRHSAGPRPYHAARRPAPRASAHRGRPHPPRTLNGSPASSRRYRLLSWETLRAGRDSNPNRQIRRLLDAVLAGPSSSLKWIDRSEQIQAVEDTDHETMLDINPSPTSGSPCWVCTLDLDRVRTAQ